jgi:hypothetical protein
VGACSCSIWQTGLFQRCVAVARRQVEARLTHHLDDLAHRLRPSSSLIASILSLEEASNPESAKDSVRYHPRAIPRYSGIKPNEHGY